MGRSRRPRCLDRHRMERGPDRLRALAFDRHDRAAGVACQFRDLARLRWLRGGGGARRPALGPLRPGRAGARARHLHHAQRRLPDGRPHHRARSRPAARLRVRHPADRASLHRLLQAARPGPGGLRGDLRRLLLRRPVPAGRPRPSLHGHRALHRRAVPLARRHLRRAGRRVRFHGLLFRPVRGDLRRLRRRAAYHRPRAGAHRQTRRRAGQGRGRRLWAARQRLGQRRGQRHEHGHLHDPADAAQRLFRAVRRRRRGRGVDGRPARAARHGRGGLHHGRLPAHPLPDDRAGRDRAGHRLLPRSPPHGGSRGEAARRR